MDVGRKQDSVECGGAMNGARRGVMLLAVLVAMMAALVNTAVAQITTTTVQDTVYSANGTPASGTVLVSWNAFTTSNGQSVPAGTTSVTIGAGGVLTVALAPNAGSTPMGNYYTAVFHLSDGTTSRQYWVIPVTVAGGGPVTLAAIKNQVLPISVAMQTVSKEYVDDAIAAASTGFPLSSSPYVLTAGDSMSGPLVLPADPVNTNQAATKHYVDTNVATVEAGLGQKVSLLPTATQAVNQPSGTSFSIAGPYATTTFSGTGTTAQATITPSTAAANPGVSGYTQEQKQMNCFQQGFDLGNNGTSAEGWSTCAMNQGTFDSTSRGIDQMFSAEFTHNGQGDTAYSYHYLTSFGGKVAASDEGVEDTVLQNHQVGYTKGTLVTPTVGTLAEDYGSTSSGVTYLWGGGNSGNPTFPVSGTLQTFSAIWTSAATAQTGEIVIATPNGSNSYTLSTVAPVPIAAGVGEQTWTPSNFGTINVTAGQTIGLYVPAGNGAANSSISSVSMSGAPSVGTYVFSTSNGAGILLKATLGAPVAGASAIYVSGATCKGYCDALAGNPSFADGGILLDTSQGGSTATVGALNVSMNGFNYTLTSGTVPVSHAWGNLIPSSCTNNGNGQGQTYTSTTCNVTLGTSPASPNNFAVSSAEGDACLTGPFQEEVAITAVGAVSAGVQSITFNTRYAWNAQSTLVMQGGACGQDFVVTGTTNTWPVAYAVVGATSSSQLYFSNCVVGSCNVNYGNTPRPTSPDVNAGGTSITVSGTTATATWGAGEGSTYNLPIGSNVIVSGCATSANNGTFPVTANSFDTYNPSLSWTNASAVAGGAGCVISPPPLSITFYPGAFITGTEGGVSGAAQLGTNSVNWTTGDILAGAPTSEFGSTSLTVVQGQATSVDGSQPSGPINIEDDGPGQSEYAISSENNIANGAASFFGYINGSYNQYFHFGYRPANNGAIIYVQGNEPVSANAKPYSIFEDNQGGGATFGLNPGNGVFSLTGGLSVPEVTATNTASKFASGTTFGGVLPCLQNGTNCPAGTGGGGGGGTGSVTSVATGAWPSWLSPTVSNATTTPTIAVTANAIPNTALANSTTTVNGQACTLGSTCTIPMTFAQLTGVASTAQLPPATAASQGGVVLPSGSTSNVLGAAAMLPGSVSVNGIVCGLGSSCSITAAPPADVKYYQAAVCDGGTAYASGLTRYDNQQPQAGCVLPASSALAYLTFNASPALPQYAEATISTPPYWTGTSMYINFYSAAVTGSVTWEVQAACINAGTVVGAPSYGAAVPVTTTVSTTANGDVVTALVSNIGTPGSNGCPSTPTTPGLLSYRIYRSASDTAAGNANLLGVTLVTGRSQ